MPYKDPQKQRECKLRWAKKDRAANPDKYKAYSKARDIGKRRAYDNARYAANPEKYKSYQASRSDRAWELHLKRKYGITREEYNALFEKQKGVCRICGSPPGSRRGRGWSDKLSVDHCHTTKKIRGLLCYKCNTGNGQFNDDPALIAKALVYLVGAEAAVALLTA